MSVKQAIQQLVDELARAWNSQDWASFSRLFAEDADYVTGSGVRLAGRGPIHRGLSTRALDSFDSGQVSLVIESIKILGPDAVVILCAWRMGRGDASHAHDSAGRAGLITIVTQRAGGTWRIVALQNTDKTL
jgi:uncharacterized protein (TIGR02246 family)